MVKYKCPKCGTLYDDVPAKCVTCGVEFLPADQQDKPKTVVAEAAPVEAAPVVAPVKEQPKEEVKVEEAPKVEEPVKEAPVYAESSEVNITSKQERTPARVIVAFIFAWLVIAIFVVTEILPYLTSVKPEPRVYAGVSLAVVGFGLAIATVVLSKHPERYTKGHGLCVAARVLGIIFLILSILNLLAWVGLGSVYVMSDELLKSTHYNFKATIDNYFLTGNFILIKG